jgi:hypothetical protein
VREGSPVKVAPTGTVGGIDLTNSSAYVATGSAGLNIYDIRTTSPSLIYNVAIIGDAYAVSVKNPFAYVTGFPANLSIFNLFAQ